MNKKQLVAELADTYYKGNRAEAERALNQVLDTITRLLAHTDDGEKVTITGFGRWWREWVEQRIVRNPKTGDRVVKYAHYRTAFAPGSDLDQAASGVVSSRVTKRIKAARARAAR